MVYMGRVDNGMQDMGEAQQAKVTEEHSVIDDAIQDRGEGYTVFSIVRPSLISLYLPLTPSNSPSESSTAPPNPS